MTKKKYYDEHGNQIRSKSSKLLYKKRLFWIIVIFGVLFGAIGLYNFDSEDAIVDDSIEKVKIKEKMKKKVLEHTDLEKENFEEQAYTYEDFKGTYVTFEGEPYKSPIAGMSDIILIGEDSYRSFNLWDFDMDSTIKDKAIVENVLTLDLESDENEQWGLHSESGREQFELRHDDDKKVLYSITNDQPLYSMSKEDLQTHYAQSKIDYARIIMTVYQEPSLDQWAVWEDEWGVPVVNVRHDAEGDPTEASKDVIYPENVTHLDLTSQVMAAGIITYSSHGGGQIIRYPMPLHYHQEDQSEEGYRQLAEEALDAAEKININPFEPYVVANFIGRVEFVDE